MSSRRHPKSIKRMSACVEPEKKKVAGIWSYHQQQVTVYDDAASRFSDII